jgi:ubiquinone biosynthesis protein
MTILTRHGFGAMASRLGLDRLRPGRLLGPADDTRATPERVRLAFEELGTTAIKLGQGLSARPDLIPPDYVTELEKLRDRVPSFPGDAIIEIVERELGGPIASLFAEFEHEPIAAASIGQVHAARLLDGTPVAVKVQKPGVIERVATDLEIIADQGQISTSPDTGRQQAVAAAIVDDPCFDTCSRCYQSHTTLADPAASAGR